MTFISTLDVINDMLGGVGESQVNALDEDHPLIAGGLRSLRLSNAREQGKGWWFNKETVTLLPDVDTGEIFVPADCLRVDPTDQALQLVQRGRRLYQSYNPVGGDPFKFTAAVTVAIIRLVPFEELPPQAAALISFSAQIEFFRQYDADQNKLSLLGSLYKDALVTLNAEHTRSIGANMLNSPSVIGKLHRIGAQANPAGYPIYS